MTHIVWAPQTLEDVHAIRTHLFRDSADYADLIVASPLALPDTPLATTDVLG